MVRRYLMLARQSDGMAFQLLNAEQLGAQ